MDIEDRVHFLGHIPKIDQMAIMKNSLAVRAILSDIPVNREIENGANLFYFEAASPTGLAEKMRGFLKKEIRRPAKEKLVARGEMRKRLFCEKLLEAACFVMGNTNGGPGA